MWPIYLWQSLLKYQSHRGMALGAGMELYLFRHGEAGSRLPASGKDAERTLTTVGEQEVREAARGLAEMGLEFDVVASSPLRRSKDTASIINKTLKRKAGVEEWSELKPEGSRGALYSRLSELRPNTSVLCVGHEPYLTTAIGEITGRGGKGTAGFRIVLKKSGMARLSISGFSPMITGELRWLLTPKQIRKLG